MYAEASAPWRVHHVHLQRYVAKNFEEIDVMLDLVDLRARISDVEILDVVELRLWFKVLALPEAASA